MYMHVYIYIYIYMLIGIVDRVFTKGLENQGLIAVWVTPKTLKTVLDTSLLTTQHYKVRIKGKFEVY